MTPPPIPPTSGPATPNSPVEPQDPRDPPLAGFGRSLRAAMDTARTEFEAAQRATTLAENHAHARAALEILATSTQTISVLPGAAPASSDDAGPIGFPQGLGLLAYDEARRAGDAAATQFARDVLGNPDKWKSDPRAQHATIQQAVAANDWRRLSGSAPRSTAIAHLMLASTSLEQARSLAVDGAREVSR